MSPARRALTDYQWIILWEIADHPSAVWFRQERFLEGSSGCKGFSVDLSGIGFKQNRDWFIELGGRTVKITHQVWVLVHRGLIKESIPGELDTVYVTGAGHAALAARDYMAVIDRYNGR